MRLDPRHYTLFAIVTGVLIGATAYFGGVGAAKAPAASTLPPSEIVITADGEVLGVTDEVPPSTEDVALADEPAPTEPQVLGWPLIDAPERVTKKPFGIFITPETSPVPDDHFSGIHVGTDFETTPDEADVDVPVFAICDGPLRMATWANGYGGVATQSCVIEGEEVTVIYGHLDKDSILPKVGAKVVRGEKIALLGAGGTEAVDGVRKHLHLGIRKVEKAVEPAEPVEPVAPPEPAIDPVTGQPLPPEPPKPPKVDIRGYIKDRAEQEKFIDALKVIQE